MSVSLDEGYSIPPGELADETPPMDIPKGVDMCKECGKQLEYKGKGRHPEWCDEHKPAGKGKTTVTRASGVRNTAIASQAADVLFTTNSFIQFLATMGGLADTADAIDSANPVFREQAFQALLNDPELAKSITRGGAMTGKMALIMAYSMFAFAVVPVAYVEGKAKAVERREAALE